LADRDNVSGQAVETFIRALVVIVTIIFMIDMLRTQSGLK
jgi:hypothetical protein